MSKSDKKIENDHYSLINQSVPIDTLSLKKVKLFDDGFEYMYFDMVSLHNHCDNTNLYNQLANKENGWEINELLNELKNPKYKDLFKSYFEAVLNKRGRIFFAVPSHEQTLIKLASKELHLSEKEIQDRWFFEPGFDVFKKMHAGYVYYNRYEGKPNRFQKRVLNILHDHKYINYCGDDIITNNIVTNYY